MHSKKIIILLVIVGILISPNFSDGTYIDNGTITILRSQFVDNPSIAVNGELTESFWNQAGLLSLKLTGGSSDVDLFFKFINDDEKLYLGFTLINLNYADLSLTIYFDADNDGVLSTPEDAKSISITNNSVSYEQSDLYWSGIAWIDDVTIDTVPFVGASSKNIGLNRVDFEIAIPLISSDLVYDGLQIPTTSNTFLGMSFQFLNDFTNGTIETFDFPTPPSNVSGYVDLRLAGPEDKDLPSYVPPVQITTSFTAATTAVSTADADVTLTMTEDSTVESYLVYAGIFALVMIIRRRR